MAKIFKKISTFIGLPFRQKWLMFAIILLYAYRFILLKINSPLAFSEKIEKRRKQIAELTPKKEKIAADIATSINRAATYIPFHNVCRDKAWQAIMLLRLYHIPYEYKVGINTNPQSTQDRGHCWVKVNNKFVTGRCIESDYCLINY